LAHDQRPDGAPGAHRPPLLLHRRQLTGIVL
jgi:hypothetical protein